MISGIARPLPFADRISLHHETHVEQREHHEREQQRREHAPRERRGTRFEDDRLRMEGPEQIHTQMNERQQHQAADAEHRRIAGPQPGVGHGTAQHQVAEENEEEEERQGEPRVPGPPRSPDGLCPEGAGGEHHETECRADFGARRRKPVVAVVFQQQEQDAGETDQTHREHRRPGGGHVHVEDLLRRSLVQLDGRVDERTDVHGGEQDESDTGEQPAALSQGHASTVAGNSSVASVTNTMSYAASNLRLPATSLKGRAANRAPVACTAQTNGGIRNGSNNTGNINSANRVLITIALNSVPTAMNPAVASAMMPTSGPSIDTRGTSKQRANDRRAAASTNATKTRFAVSFPRYKL